MKHLLDFLIACINTNRNYIGFELDKCLTRYGRQNTQEVTEAELTEYIEETKGNTNGT